MGGEESFVAATPHHVQDCVLLKQEGRGGGEEWMYEKRCIIRYGGVGVGVGV